MFTTSHELQACFTADVVKAWVNETTATLNGCETATLIQNHKPWLCAHSQAQAENHSKFTLKHLCCKEKTGINLQAPYFIIYSSRKKNNKEREDSNLELALLQHITTTKNNLYYVCSRTLHGILNNITETYTYKWESSLARNDAIPIFMIKKGKKQTNKRIVPYHHIHKLTKEL